MRHLTKGSTTIDIRLNEEKFYFPGELIKGMDQHTIQATRVVILRLNRCGGCAPKASNQDQPYSTDVLRRSAYIGQGQRDFQSIPENRDSSSIHTWQSSSS